MRHEAAHFLTGARCGQSCTVWCCTVCRWLWVSQGKRAQAVRCTQPTKVSRSLPPLAAGYLLGVPVANYSLTLGKEHTDFAGEGAGLSGRSGCCGGGWCSGWAEVVVTAAGGKLVW